MNMGLASFSELTQSTSTLVRLSENYTQLSPKELSEPIERITPSFRKTIEAYGSNFIRLPKSDGSWDGERGMSMWRPERDFTPTVYNPEGKSWGELLDKYGIDGIVFNDGEPNFSEISKGTVEITNFSGHRDANFYHASEALAEKRGCSVGEVQQWMDENDYTWHERSDCRTMDKVPSEIHANIPHAGGISKYNEIIGSRNE